MNCYYIIGLRVDHRHSNALNLQKTLTEYGMEIVLLSLQNKVLKPSS